MPSLYLTSSITDFSVLIHPAYSVTELTLVFMFWVRNDILGFCLVSWKGSGDEYIIQKYLYKFYDGKTLFCNFKIKEETSCSLQKGFFFYQKSVDSSLIQFSYSLRIFFQFMFLLEEKHSMCICFNFCTVFNPLFSIFAFINVSNLRQIFRELYIKHEH